jgi:hypothetical protein
VLSKTLTPTFCFFAKVTNLINQLFSHLCGELA